MKFPSVYCDLEAKIKTSPRQTCHRRWKLSLCMGTEALMSGKTYPKVRMNGL